MASFIPLGAATTNFWVKDKVREKKPSGHASGSNKLQVPENENNGTNSLYGGYFGYDRRTWTIAKETSSIVTFALVDPAGEQGFPGSIIAAKTPIMLTYEETSDLDGYFAQFDASRIIATDGHLIPTGDLIEAPGLPLNFSVAKSIGMSINMTEGRDYCGIANIPSVEHKFRDKVYTCNDIFNASQPIPRKASHDAWRSVAVL
ncbi:galactose mutarotase-like domain-containing protein [Desarmillaria ectypa]|nr:galactose mutarotase-like domain-containing protein [Desarmillaria ectypa]